MNGKKAIISNRSCLIYTGIAFLLFFTLCGISSAKTINIDREIVISFDKYNDDVFLAEIKEGSVLTVEIQAVTGGEIDVLLMKPSDFENYKNIIAQNNNNALLGNINYLAEGSLLHERVKKYNYTFQEAGDYYLVIDNTNGPKGGAWPLNQVEMNLKVRVDEPPMVKATSIGLTPSESAANPSPTQTQKSPGFGAMLGIFIISILILRKK